MNPLTRLLTVICACVGTQACATHPAPARTDADAAARTAAAATQSTRAPVVQRIVLEDKTLTNDEVRQLFAQGYKPVGRNGEVYYCRSGAPTGSRVASMTCKTAEQMKQIEEASKYLLTQSQKTGGCAANRTSCSP